MLSSELYPLFDWSKGSVNLEGDYSVAEAIQLSESFIAAKDERVRIFRHALVDTVGISLDGKVESLKPLDTWFVEEIKAHPAEKGTLNPYLRSLVADIALYISDIAFTEYPHLLWKVNRDKKSLFHLHPVIAGFKRAHPKFNRQGYQLWGAVRGRVLAHLIPDREKRSLISLYDVFDRCG